MNVTVTTIEQPAVDAITEPVIEAIEAATAARRADECCQADAMLEIYGFNNSSTGGSGSDSSSGSGAGGQPIDPGTDDGVAGTTDAGDPCECETINDMETLSVTQNGVTLTYNHAFQWSTCEGYNELITEPYLNSEIPVNQFVTREKTCTPTVTNAPYADCCKTVDYVITRYTGENDGTGIPQGFDELVKINTCEGSPATLNRLFANHEIPTTSGGIITTSIWGYCSTNPTDTNIYLSNSVGSAVLEEPNGSGQPALCPPQISVQTTVLANDNSGDRFYRPYSTVFPEFPAIDCTAEEEDCTSIVCDEYGDPVTNGDGSRICCECKPGQEKGDRIIAKNCCGQPLWIRSGEPNELYVRIVEGTESVFVPDQCGLLATAPPIENNEEALDGQDLTGVFWPAVIYECPPCKVETNAVQDFVSSYISKPDIECGEPGSYAESYHHIWCEWLKCQQHSQNWMQGVYGTQIVTGLAQTTIGLMCLNEILGQQKIIAAGQASNHSLVTECAQAMISTEGSLKKCEAELLKGYVNRLGLINDQGALQCQRADDEWACYSDTYGQIKDVLVPGIAEALFQTINEGSTSSTSATDWASNLDSTFAECFLPEMKREFMCILESANVNAVNINNWRKEKRESAKLLQKHYASTYKREESQTIPVIMDMTRCMVEKVCELRDYLYECGKENHEDWRCAYQQGEIDLARRTLATADSALPRAVDALEWLERNIPAFNQLAKCYRDSEQKLSQQIFREAHELAPEIQNAYRRFIEQGHDHREFWDNCWKDGQCRLVTNQLDLACRLVDCMESSIERLLCWSEEADHRYKYYENAERQTAPKVIWSGNRSIDRLEETEKDFKELTDQFRDIWEQKILPCDLKDLQKVCDIWTKTNMVEEIHRNTDDLRDMAITSKTAYERSVIHAQDLLKDIVKQESFEFCLEKPAYLHVREQFEKSKEELIRCNSRYCAGFMAEALSRLKYQQAMAEGGAFESAQRWTWWANEQLQRKRYDQSVGLFGVFNQYGSTALNAYAGANSGNALLLDTVNRTINRVYTYLQQLNLSAGTTFGINSSMVSAAQNMISTGHFWPSHAVTTQAQAISAKQAIQDDAAALLQQGNYFLDRETWATLNGGNYLNNIMGLSQQVIDAGQFWTQQAVNAETQTLAGARSLVDLGWKATESGHELHRMGSLKVGQALQASQGAAASGIGVAELGQRAAAKAFDAQTDCVQSALDHLTLSGALIDSGISLMGEVRQSYNTVNSSSSSAQGTLNNLLNLGNANLNVNRALQEQCFKQQFEMLCKAKDYTQENFKIYQDSIHGTNLSGINQLSQQINTSFNNGLADVFGGLQNFGTNNSLSSAPFAGAGIGPVGGF